MRRVALLPLLALPLLASCGRDELPTGASGPGPVSYTISDAVHSGGNPHFFFLPPMVPAPQYGGTSDADLAPMVTVCEWTGAACGATVAQFSMTAGTASEVIRYDASGELYIVNWHTDQCVTGPCTLDAAKTYRVRVLVGSRELGFADVDVVSNGSQLRNVATNEYIGLVNGRTLPVKFRIETGVAGALAVAVSPTTVRTGETATVTATVLDLHGVTLPGSAVTWSASGAALTFTPPAGPTDATGTMSTTATAGSAAGTAFITAATQGLAASTTLEILPISVDEWAVGSAMRTPRRGVGGMIGGRLYVTGGFANDGTIFGSLEAYDVASGTWQELAPMPTPRFHAAAAVLDGKLYVVGGRGDFTYATALATVEVYDPASNTWATRAPLPRGRAHLAASAVNGKLYVFGGVTGADAYHPVGDVDIYDPATDTWTSGSPMPEPRYVMSALTLQGTIFLVAGYNLNSYYDALATVLTYDPSTGAWGSIAPMNYRHGDTPAVTVLDDKIYVAGGFCLLCWTHYPSGYNPPYDWDDWMNVVEAYDPATGAWATLAPLPMEGMGQAGGAFNGKWYLAGGEIGYYTFTAALQVYTP